MLFCVNACIICNAISGGISVHIAVVQVVDYVQNSFNHRQLWVIRCLFIIGHFHYKIRYCFSPIFLYSIVLVKRLWIENYNESMMYGILPFVTPFGMRYTLMSQKYAAKKKIFLCTNSKTEKFM